MLRYALFGCKVRNGSKELEGGWHDCLLAAPTVDELKLHIEEVEENNTLMVFNEEIQRHERQVKGTVIRKYFVKPEQDIVGNTMKVGERIDWYQIVDLEFGAIIEEWTGLEECT